MILPRESVLCIAPYFGGHGALETGSSAGGSGCRGSKSNPAGLSPTLDAAFTRAELHSLLLQQRPAAIDALATLDASTAIPLGIRHPLGSAIEPYGAEASCVAAAPAVWAVAGPPGPPTAGTAAAGGAGAGGSSLTGGGRGQQSFLESLRQRDALAQRRSWVGGAAGAKTGVLNPSPSPTTLGPSPSAPPSTSALLLPRQAGLALGPLPGAMGTAPSLALSPPRAAPLSPPRQALALPVPCQSPVSPLSHVAALDGVQLAAPCATPASRSDTPQRRMAGVSSAAASAAAAARPACEPACAAASSPAPSAPAEAMQRASQQVAQRGKAAEGGVNKSCSSRPSAACAPALRLSKPAPRRPAAAAEDLQQAFFAAVGVHLAPARPGGPTGAFWGNPRAAPSGAHKLAAPQPAAVRPGSSGTEATAAAAQPACRPVSPVLPSPAGGGFHKEPAGGSPGSSFQCADNCQWGALEAEGRAFASAAGMDSDRLLYDVLAAAERAFSVPLAAA